MIFVFQLLFGLFMLYAATLVNKRRKEGVLSVRAALVWMLCWVLAALVVIYPESTSMLAGWLGIGRGVDLVVYSSIALIFFLLFRLHIKLEQNNRHLTELVRQDALKHVKEQKK